ncbi:Rrt14 protein [Saccharomycopsis crataegensis]|uniref:Regulator of rDNA transcription 14 n=1 Tax=Saccharomycopsis crataegensis TaxID=43959 RepID=A0AAV5QLQ0_9ASCO|nr:Rrt14 protein [Saccharomycopsis crataegensis]
MSFKSKSSKHQASSSINKLLGSVLPTTKPITSSKGSKKSDARNTAIQSLNDTFFGMEESTVSVKDISKLKKKQKTTKRQTMKKNSAVAEKLEKTAKMKIIQKQIDTVNEEQKKQGKKVYGKTEYNLNQEEKKLINSLIDGNVKTVQSWKDAGDSDDDTEEQIKKLQGDILALKNAKQRNKGAKNAKKRNNEFSMEQKINGKIKRAHAYPGLTPGLAPVGLDDSDEESD